MHHQQQLDLGLGPPDVDPNCLCGQPHPCPTHGPFLGPYEPYTPVAAHDPLDSFAALISVLRNDVAPHLDESIGRHQRGAA